MAHLPMRAPVGSAPPDQVRASPRGARQGHWSRSLPASRTRVIGMPTLISSECMYLQGVSMSQIRRRSSPARPDVDVALDSVLDAPGWSRRRFLAGSLGLGALAALTACGG